MKYILKIKVFINKIFEYLSDKNLGILNIIFIKIYVFIFKIDMNEYENKITEYKSFNDFFCRKLKKKSRIIDINKNAIISPADGTITQTGIVNEENNFIIKNKNYSLNNLLGKNKFLCNLFKNGKFLIIYLSPKNYHRVHMSYDGFLKYMFYIPGNLYTVNPKSLFFSYKKIFSNERVLCLFKYSFGFMMKILVGSIIVGGIETKWHGKVNNLEKNNKIKIWKYTNNIKYNNFFFKKGDEIAKFKIGSTIVLLFQKCDILNFNKNILKNNDILLGQKIININN